MHKMRGLTMIELLVALAIAAILTMLAAPSFVRVVRSNTIASGVNAFLADARYARSEAVRRGGNVLMCRSDDPEAGEPACETTGGTRGWGNGWLVFQDKDADGTWSAGDVTLRVQTALPSITIAEGSGNATIFNFTATGRLKSTALTAKLMFGGSDYDTALQRVVCMSAGGRPRIAGNGSTDCGTDNE